MRRRQRRENGRSATSVPKRVVLRESQGSGFLRKQFDFELGDVRPDKRTGRYGLAALLSLVLPHGYPESVTSDYARFQLWDTLQALSTYLRGILSQQSLLEGLGVGDASATAISAALSYCFLSGMSMAGGIVFAFRISVEFGADPKRWRLFADVINDIGLTLNLLAPLAGPFFLIAASLGSICTAVCGVAAGATKVAITQHFVKDKSNAALLSDLHAKEGTQETIVSLSGLVLGSGLAFLLDKSLLLRWIVFFSLTAVHIFANYQAVSCLCLETLNEQRASILIDHFLRFHTVLDPIEVSRRELVWNTPAPSRIRLGVPLHSLVYSSKTYTWFQTSITREPTRNYVLRETDGFVDVLLHESAASMDILQAFFYSKKALLNDANDVTKESDSEFCSFVEDLRRKNWAVDQVMLSDESWRCHW